MGDEDIIRGKEEGEEVAYRVEEEEELDVFGERWTWGS